MASQAGGTDGPSFEGELLPLATAPVVSGVSVICSHVRSSMYGVGIA